MNIIISDFKKVFRNMVDQAILSKRDDKDPHPEINVAVALYFACYFNITHYTNNPTRYMEYTDNDSFVHFLEKHKREKDAKMNHLKLKYQSDFKHYKKDCIEAEKGNLNKLFKVIHAKKLYSIPWLIAGNILMDRYP